MTRRRGAGRARPVRGQAAGFAVALPVAFALAAIGGCGRNPLVGAYESARDECLVPCDQLISTGKGQDSIGPLTNPYMVSATAAETSYLVDTDRVLGIVAGPTPQALAYPVKLLNYHQIANEVGFYAGGAILSVTYDPLTRSGAHLDLAGLRSTMGSSGYVYNSNLVLYDHNEKGLWSQLLAVGLKGPRKGHALPVRNVLETSWLAWRTWQPQTKVAARPYSGYAYDTDPNATYHASASALMYPVSPLDSRLPPKHEVIGLAPTGGDGANVVWPIASLAVNPVRNESVGPLRVAVAYDAATDTAVVFERPQAPSGTAAPCGGGVLCFASEPSSVPAGIYLRDDATGTFWTLDGTAQPATVAGTGILAGQRLRILSTYSRCYWFAWGAMFPGAEIR